YPLRLAEASLHPRQGIFHGHPMTAGHPQAEDGELGIGVVARPPPTFLLGRGPVAFVVDPGDLVLELLGQRRPSAPVPRGPPGKVRPAAQLVAPGLEGGETPHLIVTYSRTLVPPAAGGVLSAQQPNGQ